ncbi:DUF1127 domain-containing protein [Sedimentimonas flavescens]|uniref:DUF1127 domain-containing protein n=1 Tax=Sedimentimonas flavescens TaxID=2851012 RepID=A0ABT2ZUA8_9RHOB|nr:DUF1127 domain-containing protein [Sedimentimonas flavescens]MBW0156904.1 DUF1127 domain-containing protein [Sedimentimonas flavescens]MCT2539396.1 DUF1127 domain-containing protein [Sedimentimonas flavescens]MCV2877324.1 DUF1127 domain-containing protein [Sedimentimonas flavescens]WBL32649.1 DUF1127 domain-containing protein [Sinirhodobacter sp. HNIBRBA609]
MSAADTTLLSVRNTHAGFVSKMINSVLAWNDARVTRNALSRLTDRELADIGLTRFDIDRVAG